MSSDHLSDVQFADLLAENSFDTDAQDHLAVCSVCRAEVQSVRSSTALFHDLGSRWAEDAAPRLVVPPSRMALRFAGTSTWRLGAAALATAAVLAVGLRLPSPGWNRAGEGGQTSASVPSNREFAQDNELMQSIDQELEYRAAPAVPTAQLRALRHRESRSESPVVN